MLAHRAASLSGRPSHAGQLRTWHMAAAPCHSAAGCRPCFAPVGISEPSAMPSSKRHCWYAAASVTGSSGSRHERSSCCSSLRWPKAPKRGSGGQQSAHNHVRYCIGSCSADNPVLWLWRQGTQRNTRQSPHQAMAVTAGSSGQRRQHHVRCFQLLSARASSATSSLQVRHAAHRTRI